MQNLIFTPIEFFCHWGLSSTLNLSRSFYKVFHPLRQLTRSPTPAPSVNLLSMHWTLHTDHWYEYLTRLALELSPVELHLRLVFSLMKLHLLQSSQLCSSHSQYSMDPFNSIIQFIQKDTLKALLNSERLHPLPSLHPLSGWCNCTRILKYYCWNDKAKQ